MRRSRQIIVVALVATALCAGRMTLAVPQPGPRTQLAGRIISRLSSGLRRAVTARLYQPRRENARVLVVAQLARPRVIHSARISFSPFHFRLPPPLA
ncbi:MAG: hypothetical protein M3O30_00905 [Planctomycetota bacterium]|nr:hypothetical protein [Planctomycetota bacterium]